MRKLQLFNNSTPSPLLPEVVARAAACPAERVARAVLELLELEPEHAVLELGCGSGRTLAAVAARLRGGFVAGVDPSELMVRHAAARNRRAIAQGRGVVLAGSSRDLGRFPPASFDRVYGTHVVYFWSEPRADLAEIARVLRPGGELLLGFFPAAEGAPRRVAFPVERALALLRDAGFLGAHATGSAGAPGLAFARARKTAATSSKEGRA